MIDRTGEVFFDDARRRVTLAKLVKSGGAGSVHLLRESPQLVAKIYHPSVDHATYARKVAAMLQLSPDLPDLVDGAQRMVQIAWPTSLLRDAQGRFVGFLMPAVDVKSTCELELILQEKQARAEGLPTGLGPKITLAANLSAVVAALHARHHYIVDLKPVNLRFYKRTLNMAMLDCDGLSIQGTGERFPAPQFTPDYLAPEFQRNGITPDGEQAQDRFALAVVVFQLLNFGIHPFTGRPVASNVPTDIPGRIAGRWYAYGAKGNTGIAPSPVSGHARMPSELRAMFDRAFESRGFGRPAAHEWQALLQSFARRSTGRMVVCSRDAVHQHYAGLDCAHCEREQLLRKARAAQTAHATTTRTTAHTRRATARPTTRRQPNVRRTGTGQFPTTPPIYAPRAPAPAPLSPMASYLLRKLRQFAMGTLVLVVLMVIDRCSDGVSEQDRQEAMRVTQEDNLRRAVEEYGYEPPPPTAAPAPAAPSNVQDYTPPLDVIVGDFEWIVAYANLAGEYNADLGAIVKTMREGASRWPPTADKTLRAYRAVIDTGVPHDQLRMPLAALLRSDPRATEVATELGLIELRLSMRDAAMRDIQHAIAVAPDSAAAWYALALARSASVQDMYGALSIAEALMPEDEAKAEAVRNRILGNLRAYYPPSPGSGSSDTVDETAARDARRFEIVAARARVRVAQWRHLRAPETVEALARLPLPQ